MIISPYPRRLDPQLFRGGFASRTPEFGFQEVRIPVLNLPSKILKPLMVAKKENPVFN
jgi:hypothetical protein